MTDKAHPSEMDQLRLALQAFSREREWQPFHTTKNLAMALSVEVSELVELFQWHTPEQSKKLTLKNRLRLGEEVGDVMIYLTMLAARHGLDPLQCAREKMVLNEEKYPARQVRGKADKYTEYGSDSE